MGFFKRRALRKQLDVLRYEEFNQLREQFEELAYEIGEDDTIPYSVFTKYLATMRMNYVGFILADQAYKECPKTRNTITSETSGHVSGSVLSVALMQRLADILRVAPEHVRFPRTL